MAQYARTAGETPPLAAPVWSAMAEVTQILCPKCHKPNLRRAKFCQHCGHDVVLNNNPPSDERRYVITRVIKEGGQGAVYEGIDDSGKVYAIKEMLDRFTDPKERAEAIERFNDEAEMLQRLSHPRIPRVYSHFQDEGRHYLTMDFVRGEDLEEIVEREGPLDEARVLGWADQICDVLAHLHGKNLIYRDMKPSNVMIDRADGGIKVVDFGITRLFKPTERGTQIGTPGYAPPEQYQGLATPQSDVYALGATLHHLLTGRDPTDQLPFSFPRADQVPGAKVSKRTADALERALQKVPQDRFATVSELWAALRPEQAPQVGQVRRAPPTARIPQPAAAQVGAPPAMAQGGGAAAARPAPAQPAASPPPPYQPARPAPPRVQPRRGFLATVGAFISALVRLVLTAALLGAIGLGAYVYFQRPAWAEPYVGPVLDLVPTALPGAQTSAPPGPTAQPVPTGPVSFELEVTVSSGADAAAVRQAFLEAYAARAQAEYGPTARVNTNVPPGYIGGAPALVSDDGAQKTYTATVQGYLFAGQ